MDTFINRFPALSATIQALFVHRSETDVHSLVTFRMPLINFLLILLSLSLSTVSTSSYGVSLDVCQVITVVESVTIFSTYIPTNTAISIDNTKTITITNAPTTIFSTITLSSTLTPDTHPPPSTDHVLQWITSTMYRDYIYIITSCAPTVTDSPTRIGQVTTDTTIDYMTIYPLISSAEASDTEYYTTVTIDKFTIVCPTPTTFTHGTQTYTVTDSSAITITDCPCILTHSFTPSAPSASSTASITSSISKSSSPTIQISPVDVSSTVVNFTTSPSFSEGSSNPEASTAPSAVSSASSSSLTAPFIVGVIAPGALSKKRQDTKSYLLANGRLTSDCSKAISLIISEGRLLDATNPMSYYSVPPHTEFENFLPNSLGTIPNGSVSIGFSISLEKELVWNPGFDSVVDVLFALNYQGVLLAVFDAILPPDSNLVELEVITLSNGDCPKLPSIATSLQPPLATWKTSLDTSIPSTFQISAIQSSGIFTPPSSVMWANSLGPAQPTSHATVSGISTSAHLLTRTSPEPTTTPNTSNDTIYSVQNARSGTNSSDFSTKSLRAMLTSTGLSYKFTNSLQMTSTTFSLVIAIVTSDAQSVVVAESSISVAESFSAPLVSTIQAYSNTLLLSFTTSSPITAVSSQAPLTSLPTFLNSSRMLSLLVNTSTGNSLVEPGTTTSSTLPISSFLFTNGSNILPISSLTQTTKDGSSFVSLSALFSSAVSTAFVSTSSPRTVYSPSPIIASTSEVATTSMASSVFLSSSVETGSFVEVSIMSSGILTAGTTSSFTPGVSISGIEAGSSGAPSSSASESELRTTTVYSLEEMTFSTSELLANSAVSSSTLSMLPATLQLSPMSSSLSDTMELNTPMSSQVAVLSTIKLLTGTIQSSAVVTSRLPPSFILSEQPSGTNSFLEPSTFIISSLSSLQSEVSMGSAAPSEAFSTLSSLVSFTNSGEVTTSTSSSMVILTTISAQESITTSPSAAPTPDVSPFMTLTSSSATAFYTPQEFLLAVHDYGQPFEKVADSHPYKRENPQKYGYIVLIGDMGFVVSDESDATLFTTDGSHLFANGKYCGADYSQVASGYGNFQTFSTEPDISTAWNAALNQQITFTNTAFTLTEFSTAVFCITSEYVLFNEYTSEYPDTCTHVFLLAELPPAPSSSTTAQSTIFELSTSRESSIPSNAMSSSCSSKIAPRPTCGANQVLANPSFEDSNCNGPLSSPWSSSGHETTPMYTGGFGPIYVSPEINLSDIFQKVSCLDTTMMYSASFFLEVVSFEDEDIQISWEPSCVVSVFLGNTWMATIPIDNLPKTGYNYVTTNSVLPSGPSESFIVVLSHKENGQATCLVHVTDFTLGPQGPDLVQTTSFPTSITPSPMESMAVAASTSISVTSSSSAAMTNSASLCSETSVIVNGDFEDSFTDIDPWTLTNAVQPIVERDPGFAYSGNNTLLIYKSDLNATEAWSLNQTIQTYPNTPYFLSFYARANGDNSTLDTACPISVCFDSDCKFITTLYNYDFGYSQYYRLFHGFPYATNLTVSIESDACGQYIFIDDVTFTVTTPGYTPPPPADIVDCSGRTTPESCTNVIGCYWSTYYEHCYDYSYGS